MDNQRIDELQELITHNLNGSGIRAQPKARVQELVARLAEGARQSASPFVPGDIGQRRIDTPRTAAQSEAVIASSQGKHLAEVVGSGTPTPAAE